MSSRASSSGTTASTSLASLYECPVCFDYISPPIYQCSNGHMVCSNCSSKLDRCPTCQGPLGTSRNLALEKALSAVHFPCKFSDDGCPVTILLAAKSTHEGNCPFGPTFCSCPFKASCEWKGRMDQIMLHFRSQHSCVKIIQGDHCLFEFNLKSEFFLGSGFWWGRLLNCLDHHFLLILKLETRKPDDVNYYRFLAAVLLIGAESEAENFSYKLKLSRGDRHQLKWEATPLSINVNLNSVAKTHECLVLEGTDIGEIFTKNGKLVFNVKVERYSSKVN